MGGSSGKGTVLEFMMPFGGAQAMKNTADVLKGEQQLGVHENWFGNSAAGDFLNPIMGGNTQADRVAWDEYYVQQAKNDAVWKEAMDKNLQGTVGVTGQTPAEKKKELKKRMIAKPSVTSSSLFFDEEEET